MPDQVEREQIPVAKGADIRPLLLTFGGKGCKVVLWNGDNPKNPEEGLHIILLQFKDDERKVLSNLYGKLPPPPRRVRPRTRRKRRARGR